MKKQFVLKLLTIITTLILFSSHVYSKQLLEICSDKPSPECLVSEAEKLANGINDTDKRKINQAIIATTWSAIGLNDRAIKLVMDIGDVSKVSTAFARASILSDMSLVYAKNGNKDK